MTLAQLIRLLQSSVCFGTVIMYGSIGEILTEKSGNLNLGVPGIMYLGGISGLAASFFYEFNNPDPSPVICLLLSFIAAFLASAVGSPGLCKLIDGLGGAFGLVRGMTGACALLLLVSILASVSAVTG